MYPVHAQSTLYTRAAALVNVGYRRTLECGMKDRLQMQGLTCLPEFRHSR